MALFGVLFVLAGLVYLASPLFPANRTKQRGEKAVLVLIGVFFVFGGAAKIAGVEDHPASTAVVLLLVVAVLTPFAYSRMSEEAS